MKERALQLRRQAVGSPRAQFRPGQWEAIEALVERHERPLVVQRTGWGKSIVYFVAAKLLRDRGAGCALLISPPRLLAANAQTAPAACAAYPPELAEESRGFPGAALASDRAQKTVAARRNL